MVPNNEEIYKINPKIVATMRRQPMIHYLRLSRGEYLKNQILQLRIINFGNEYCKF